MPRTARIRSASRIYHVMLRGINKQQVFYDHEDYEYFKNLLQRVGQISEMQIYAYCLMGNHIHLLVREGKEPLEISFRRIGAAFVYYYNLKYDRVGHLFQDRFKSEPVESDAYYLTALRYILQNPVKAGLCEHPEDYVYSSAREYLSGCDGITETGFPESFIGKAELQAFLREPNDDTCLEMPEETNKHVTDTEACRLIRAEFGTMQPSPGKAKDRAAFNLSVQRLLRTGISIRQLGRLTGLSKKIIENSK